MLALRSSRNPACMLLSASLLPGYDFAEILCPELAFVTSESTCISVGVLSPFRNAFCSLVFIVNRLMASFLLDIDYSIVQRNEATVFRCPYCSNTDWSEEVSVWSELHAVTIVPLANKACTEIQYSFTLPLWNTLESSYSFHIPEFTCSCHIKILTFRKSLYLKFVFNSSNQLHKHSQNRNSNT